MSNTSTVLKRPWKLILTIFVCLLALEGWSQQNVYVDGAATGANNGTTWPNAYTNLSDALNSVVSGSSAVNIYVAKGTYYPTGAQNGTDRDIAFNILRSGIKLYGGYPTGGGTRNPVTNPVYLNGNINNPADSTDNSYHVLVIIDIRTPADSLVIDGFTILNGNADGTGNNGYKGFGIQRNSGGGLFAFYSGLYTRISNCNFINNTAAIRGGGIYNTNSPLFISNCTLSNNRSVIDGGAIFNTDGSSTTVYNCTFSENIAKFGGGIYNLINSNAVIKKSNFTQNKASEEGGGIYNNVNSSPLIDSCVISDNSASSAAGMLNNTNSNAVVKNSQFIHNVAIVNGGGIFNTNGSEPQFDNCIISGNAAVQGAGMVNTLNSKATIRNTSFIQNNASLYGGGIFNANGSEPQFDKCIISGNTAAQGAGMVNTLNSNVVIRNTSFIQNNASLSGGGIYNNNKATALIDSCEFSENTANNGGGIYNKDTTNPTIKNTSFIKNAGITNGGGIYNLNASSPLTYNCIFSDNTAKYGGGIYNYQSSNPVVRKCSFIQNKVTTDGGGIYNYTQSSPLIDSCIFSKNVSTYGGGVYCMYSSNPVIKDSRFTKDTAISAGGGIFSRDDSHPSISKCELIENIAQFGGAIYGIYANIPITSCRIDSNQASIGGGALFQYGGYFQINNSKFTGNTAQYGGALRNEQSNNLLIKNSIFELNRSTNTGAALSLFQGSDTLVNNIFIRNKDNSSVGGGAVCVASGNYIITNNTFYADSTSNGRGGAVRLESATGVAKIYNNIFYKCYAGAADNDVHNAGGLPLNQSNNNYSIDPAFVNENDPDGADNTWGTADDGLALAFCSPANNAGNNTFVDASTVTDIIGQPRIRLTTVDQGAYEGNRAFSLNQEYATLPANTGCGNNGWIHYYNTTGDRLLASVKLGTNSVGTITVISNLRTGYGTNSTAVMTAPFGKSYNFHPFNRSWTITTSNAPADSVGVRFYFGAADSSDVRNTAIFNLLKDLILYKVDGTDAWNTNAIGYKGYTYATTATKTTFTLGTYQGLQYAEFYVTSFSSGTMAAVPPTALPLDLLSFSGKLINNKTKLQWLSSNEVNVARFKIERSNNNNSWSAIGQVQARNTTGDQTYELWDNNPANGINYYRLKMIDKDGQFKYSTVITLRTNGPSLQMYPNPNNGQFTIQIDNAGRTTSFQLFDVSGKMVHRQQLVQGINKVNLKTISAGIYVVRIEDELQSHTERLIITK